MVVREAEPVWFDQEAAVVLVDREVSQECRWRYEEVERYARQLLEAYQK